MTEERSTNARLYQSLVSGEPLTLRGARIATVGPDDLPRRPQFRGRILPADLSDKRDIKAIKAINTLYWGSLEQDIFGRTYYVLDYDNLLARPRPDEPDADEPSCHGIAGNAAVTVEKEGWLHIVVLHVWPRWHGRGVGRALLNAVIDEARRKAIPTIKLGTTNDNLPALYFYQKAGFVIEEVVPGLVIQEHGGEMDGFAGIPVRDEIRMRLDL